MLNTKYLGLNMGLRSNMNLRFYMRLRSDMYLELDMGLMLVDLYFELDMGLRSDMFKIGHEAEVRYVLVPGVGHEA